MDDVESAKKLHRSAWGATLGIALLVAISLAFPNRYSVGAGYFRNGFTVALSVMLVVSFITSALHASWRARNLTVLVVVGLMSLFNALTLAQLILFMVFPSPHGTIDGLRLLSSAVAIWLTNVVSFALLYWVIDGNGPDDRARDPKGFRDFAFPGDTTFPVFADYLFLAFNTATAFSPTDIVPLTTRTRVMMMVESVVSLVALAVVAARAVNILQ